VTGRIEVSATWSTATAAFDVSELRRGATALPPASGEAEPDGEAGTTDEPGTAAIEVVELPPAAPLDDRGGDPA